MLNASLPENPKNITTDCRTTDQSATAVITEADGTTWELAFSRTGEVGLHIQKKEPDGTIQLDRQLENYMETNHDGGVTRR